MGRNRRFSPPPAGEAAEGEVTPPRKRRFSRTEAESAEPDPFEPDAEAAEPHTGEVAYYREHKPTFGPYVRKLREDRGLSLRDAADQLYVNFSKLQKMETGGRFRITSLDIFKNLAVLYGVAEREIMTAAGIRLLEPTTIANERDDDRHFAQMVLHPALRPVGMDDRWLDSFSSVQKGQWLEFARRLERFVADGQSLDSILNSGPTDNDQ